MPNNILDTHVHIWGDGQSYAKPDHAGASPSVEDASLPAFLEAMRDTGIASAVLVQYIGYRWNNEYVAQAIALRPDILAGVCRVDPEDPAAPDHLSHLTLERGFHGVRLSLKPDTRGDWVNGPLAGPLFSRAADLKIPVLILTTPPRLNDLIRVLDRHPDLDVVIDHMADCDAMDPEHRHLLRSLAANPRVYLKTGHLWVRSVQDYPWRDQQALVKFAGDHFGASRLMWGSDWSFCRSHATYLQTLSYLRDEAAFLTAEDREWIFGATARRLWQFSEPTPDVSGHVPVSRFAAEGA